MKDRLFIRDYLDTYFDEVEPYDFYRAIFPAGELEEKGQKADCAQILADIKERDERDSSRAIAPLKAADDAVLFNNSGYTPEQSLAEALAIVKDRLGIPEV